MPSRFRPVPVKLSGWLKLFLLFVSLVMLLPLYFSVETIWGAANLGYQVTGESLRITYAWRGATIPLSSIHSVEVIHPAGLSRIAGNNTPGLYSGRWSSRETGPLNLYATRLDSLVVVKTAEGSWGLTPAEPVAFTAAVKNGTAGIFPAAPAIGNPLVVVIPLFLLVLVVVPGIWWILRLVERFPKVLSYELGPSELVIETGWRPVRVPYSEIESVEETTLKGWPLRTMGAAMKGVYWGQFAWSAVPARRINLYATQLKPIVLIRAGKRSFGLSPADAAGFVAALRERI
jgi:hypothetical protein